jgi:hypothetical protein
LIGLAGIVWWECFGGNILAQNFWREYFGGNNLAGIFWQEYFGAKFLAGIFWRELLDPNLVKFPFSFSERQLACSMDHSSLS